MMVKEASQHPKKTNKHKDGRMSMKARRKA